MKFIQFAKNEWLNIDSIETIYPHYLGGTSIIGKSGKTYTTNLTIEAFLDLIQTLENEE